MGFQKCFHATLKVFIHEEALDNLRNFLMYKPNNYEMNFHTFYNNGYNSKANY